MFFAAALLFATGPAPAPVAYRLDYECEFVVFRPDQKPAVLSRASQRVERPVKGEGARIVYVEDGEKTVTTFSSHSMTAEVIRPDGSRQSQTFPMDAKSNPLMAMFASVQGPDTKQLYHHDLKEFKTIAGLRCQKHVAGISIKGDTSEIVQWTPVNPALASRLPALEDYYYTVDGDERTLTKAGTMISLKLGKKAGKYRLPLRPATRKPTPLLGGRHLAFSVISLSPR